MNRFNHVIAVAALASGGPAFAAVLQVPQQFNTIQDAIAVSQDGDTIQLGPGVYSVPVDFSGKDIVLQGAGMGATILDGSQANGSVVRMTSGEGTTAELKDLTIQFGNAAKGGGLLLEGASPRITRCRFQRNVAENGGGVWMQGGEPRFIECEFLSNTTITGHGGGVYADGASPVFAECLFHSNSATLHAGAIYLQYSEAAVEDSDFVQNTGDQLFCMGGAILSYEGHLHAADCTFTANSSGSFGAVGVLAGLQPSSSLFDGCHFIRNRAVAAGGLGGAVGARCLNGGASVDMDGCTFRQNTADSGGALYAWDLVATDSKVCSLVLHDCLMQHNAAVEGGAMGLHRGVLAATASTFDSNRADKRGGAVQAVKESSLQLADVLLRGNCAASGGGIHQDHGTLQLDHCRFVRNVARDGGGGCMAEMAAVTDVGSEFTLCSARFGAAMMIMEGDYIGSDGLWAGNMAELGGGAQLAFKSNVSLDGCSISENTCGSTGGALAYGMCTVSIDRCEVVDNSSDFAAGGAWFGDGETKIVESRFANNHSGSGGGMFLSAGQVDLESCEIVDNTAIYAGGGILSQSDPSLSGTIVCGNSPDDIDGPWTDLGGNTVDCCPMDLDGDGVVGISDVIMLLGSLNQPWAPDPTWDFNGDGTVDVLDAVLIFNSQGPC